jgi:hypothetical protein
MGAVAKRLEPRVPLLAFFAAAMLPDLLLWAFMLVPGWHELALYLTHSALMGGVWSLVAGLVAFAAFKAARPAVLVGLATVSHTALDIVSWPLASPDGNGFITGEFPLAFEGSPMIGLRLYSTQAGFIVAESIWLVIVVIVLYLAYRKRKRKPAGAPPASE